MRGLCQKCFSTNMETFIQDGIPVCAACRKAG